ncbi:MAG: hypothetical protein LBP50_09455, partial [Tannerella sp.]|nr:hypothetical protein [Tannerella sp.]
MIPRADTPPVNRRKQLPALFRSAHFFSEQNPDPIGKDNGKTLLPIGNAAKKDGFMLLYMDKTAPKNDFMLRTSGRTIKT